MAIKEIITLEEYKKEIEESKKVSVIDFWAPWCGPCKMIAPIFKAVSEEDEFKDVNFFKVNVDEADELARQFNVMSIPTLVVIKGGEAVDIARGALSPDLLKSFIKKNL